MIFLLECISSREKICYQLNPQARILSAEFKNLPSEDAALWKKASNEDKARHDREMEVYNNHHQYPLPPLRVTDGVDSCTIVSTNNIYTEDQRVVTIPIQEIVVENSSNCCDNNSDPPQTASIVDDDAVVIMSPKAKRSKMMKGNVFFPGPSLFWIHSVESFFTEYYLSHCPLNTIMSFEQDPHAPKVMNVSLLLTFVFVSCR